MEFVCENNNNITHIYILRQDGSTIKHLLKDKDVQEEFNNIINRLSMPQGESSTLLRAIFFLFIVITSSLIATNTMMFVKAYSTKKIFCFCMRH